MSCRVAVRTLCEFTARKGDLDLRFTPAPTALEGMEGHRLVQSRRSQGYETEIALSGQHRDLLVSGRADGFDPAAAQLEEIKTYRGHLESVRPHHRALHWAQAKVYGHLLCQDRGLSQLKIALVYFNIGTQQESVLVQSFAATELQTFFTQQCEHFLAWAQSEARHRQARNQALAALQFPLGVFRSGQRELSVAVYRTVQADAGNCLMAQAPTGIGKTMGTIFPMLKACPTQALDKLFFLTAKGTGHALALQALEQVQAQLQAQSHASALRVLQLQARDKSCEHPDKACHGESCPLARGFYDRLPAAREQACGQSADSDTRSPLQRVRSIALQHQICPYYLTQELAHWADVVIGDYYYFFDSSAMLYALTQANRWRVGVLVDEAHNLLERARKMYSAELSQPALAAARKNANANANGKVKKALDSLQRHWSAFNQQQQQAYQHYDEPPASVLGALQRAIAAIADVQADTPLLPGDPVLDFYLQALSWQALAESFGPHAMVDNQRLQRGAGRTIGGRAPWSTLCIRNVIPAPYLAPRFAAAQATVLFSGTLAPAHFYQDMLGLPEATRWLDVPGPFRAEQLRVQIASHVSTRFADRELSVPPIIDLVSASYHQQPGNYLCFFSSFDYLQRVATQLQALHPDIPVWQQTAAMDEAERTAFLERFGPNSQGIGFAVLGGVFAEGVDLPGKRLIGAFIATLGLPQLNPVNERMMAAIAQRFDPRKAYDYTYLYPGLRKVVQAAGRVIRTEQDQGLVVLMDDRYLRPQVQVLLPGWWRCAKIPQVAD